jgi:hypothetical protein
MSNTEQMNKVRLLSRRLGFQLASLLLDLLPSRRPKLTEDEQAQIERVVNDRFPETRQ